MNEDAGFRLRPGLTNSARASLLERFRNRRPASAVPGPRRSAVGSVPEEFLRFDRHPEYVRLLVSQTAARQFQVNNPFFRVHDAAAGATTVIGGREYIN